jgi:hypothetical protein
MEIVGAAMGFIAAIEFLFMPGVAAIRLHQPTEVAHEHPLAFLAALTILEIVLFALSAIGVAP